MPIRLRNLLRNLRPFSRAMVAAIACLLIIAPRVLAADQTPPKRIAVFEFDPAKSTIDFLLTGWPHDTHGTFRMKSGLIKADPATGKMEGSIVIDAASGNSGVGMRDDRMRSSILNAHDFPDITFSPTQLESPAAAQGEFPVRVRGMMTLHGGTHKFTIDGTMSRDGDIVTIHCKFAIPYVEWGLENPSILMLKVSESVEIDATAVAHLSWIDSASASAAPMPSPAAP